jgi:hypothetical protein
MRQGKVPFSCIHLVSRIIRSLLTVLRGAIQQYPQRSIGNVPEGNRTKRTGQHRYGNQDTKQPRSSFRELHARAKRQKKTGKRHINTV